MKYKTIENKEEQVTHKEASNPKSKWYDEHWYENYDVPPEHEWFDIIGRFLHYKLRISEIKKATDGIKSKAKNARHIKLAFEKLNDLVPAVEFFIRHQQCTEHFLDVWGDFNKYYGMLDFAFTKGKTLEKAGELGKEKTNVDAQRQWFAMWIVYYMKRGKNFMWAKHEFFKFLNNLKRNKRNIPKELPIKWLSKILAKDGKSLKSTYQKKISEKEIHKMVANPDKNLGPLPPVGEEFYSKK